MSIAKAALERIVIELADEMGRHNGTRVNAIRFSTYLGSKAGAATLTEKDVSTSDRISPLGNANPSDLQARQDLAMALFAKGDNAGAMAQLLESIRIDRGWSEDAARLQLLELFKTLGAANPDVMTARRQLSTLLFA